MRLCSLYSGSSGNSIYVGSDHTHILVDIGMSAKKITEALHEIEIKPEEIDAIVITHEHTDHIAGLGVFLRKYGIPVYGTSKTLEAVSRYSNLGKVDFSLFHGIEPEKSFAIEDLWIKPISTWHDAADPVCYTITNENSKVSIATDLGDYDDHIVDALSDADAMLIEANHDIRMLEVGPYPYPLKQRILGRLGHLSNERGGQLVRALLNNHLKGIYLGHLSKENNYPELALEAVKSELIGNPFSNDCRDFNLSVASRSSCSALIEC
ncbi:MAG: MBL fold metallo-hydrolase [Oscillospiraceae bacterium]|nr:MBL fold metallo-hydrolase [Oscillospiraceae bacterium]